MNFLSSRFSLSFCLSLVLVGLGGCSLVPKAAPDPTRYYVLDGAEAIPSAAPAADGLRLGLGQVRVAAYLDTRSMVVREEANRLRFVDTHRWAEPLPAALGRVLAQRLAVSPGVGRVQRHPYALEVERDWDVSVEITRCEGVRQPDGSFTVGFVAVAEIANPRQTAGATVMRETFVAPTTVWDGRDYAALAAGVGTAAEALAEQIAARVAALP
jgi:uncharacterized protein